MKKVELYNVDASLLEKFAEKYETSEAEVLDALFYHIERNYGDKAIEEWIDFQLGD